LRILLRIRGGMLFQKKNQPSAQESRPFQLQLTHLLQGLLFQTFDEFVFGFSALEDYKTEYFLLPLFFAMCLRRS
jgi:hypothetical protein